MARPFTRQQALQNRAFLKVIARTGNARAAARGLGLRISTMKYRRAGHPAFAQEWDAALVLAHARFHVAGGHKGPEATGRDDGPASYRTKGGEGVVVRHCGGKLQFRSAQPGKLTRAAEQAFLAALSATANIRLSAAAAGATATCFYQRRRTDPGFAREMRLALQMGYERLEMALLESWQVEAHEHDAWRHNDPPPVPPMSVNQALQLMYLHQKEARLEAEPPHIKRRRGESSEAHSYRLSQMYEARLQRAREAFNIAEAARRERGEPWIFGPKELPPLPDLAQVTGWSRADPGKVPHHEDVALFGGWRLRDLEKAAGDSDRYSRTRRTPGRRVTK